MTVTRSQLNNDFVNSNNVHIEHFIDDMFKRVCNEVKLHNMYGFTKYTKDFKYTQYWRTEFSDKLVEKLKNYYTDSIVTSMNDYITIDWTLPKNNITTSVHENDTNETTQDIEINITLPSRIRTRSSYKTGCGK